MRITHAIIAAIVVAGLTACGSGYGPSGPGGGGGGTTPNVQVLNNRFSPGATTVAGGRP